MLRFWRHGYEGTAVSDLTAAMGITAPSLYAAFGDKRRLFLAAVDRYVGDPVSAHLLIDAASTARDAAEALLVNSAIVFTGTDTPPGCLLATAAVSGSPASASVQEALAAIRRDIERRLAARIATAIRAGEVRETTDPQVLAAMVMAVLQGLSTLARDGAPRSRLLAVVDGVMAAWPSSGP